MGKSGEDLFSNDHPQLSKTLLHSMATQDEFLIPLRSFQARRLYSNLYQDFVVPVGTSSLLSAADISRLREKYRYQYGVVEVIQSSREDECGANDSTEVNPLEYMQRSLDACGWEKIIVHFRTVLPLAHNMIAAVNKYPQWLTGRLLGFNNGRYLMRDAANWLTSPTEPSSS